MIQKIDYPTDNDMKIVFGDWCMATLKGIKIDEPSNKVILVFAPDKFMRWKHQIPDSDYDETLWVIKKEYPMEYCHCVNPDPRYQTWFLVCDYKGEKCDPAVGINHNLLVQNQSLKTQRDAWQTSATITPLILKKAIKHPEEFREEVLEGFAKQKKAVQQDIFPSSDKSKEGEE